MESGALNYLFSVYGSEHDDDDDDVDEESSSDNKNDDDDGPRELEKAKERLSTAAATTGTGEEEKEEREHIETTSPPTSEVHSSATASESTTTRAAAASEVASSSSAAAGIDFFGGFQSGEVSSVFPAGCTTRVASASAVALNYPECLLNSPAKSGGSGTPPPNHSEAGSENIQIQCIMCSVELSKDDLACHISAVHLQYFPFECGQCHGFFSSQKLLDLHVEQCSNNPDPAGVVPFPQRTPALDESLASLLRMCEDTWKTNQSREFPTSRPVATVEDEAASQLVLAETDPEVVGTTHGSGNADVSDVLCKKCMEPTYGLERNDNVFVNSDLLYPQASGFLGFSGASVKDNHETQGPGKQGKRKGRKKRAAMSSRKLPPRATRAGGNRSVNPRSRDMITEQKPRRVRKNLSSSERRLMQIPQSQRKESNSGRRPKEKRTSRTSNIGRTDRITCDPLADDKALEDHCRAVVCLERLSETQIRRWLGGNKLEEARSLELALSRVCAVNDSVKEPKRGQLGKTGERNSAGIRMLSGRARRSLANKEPCKLCGEMVALPAFLQHAIVAHFDRDLFYCPHCPEKKRFSAKHQVAEIRQHIRKHHKGKEFGVISKRGEFEEELQQLRTQCFREAKMCGRRLQLKCDPKPADVNPIQNKPEESRILRRRQYAAERAKNELDTSLPEVFFAEGMKRNEETNKEELRGLGKRKRNVSVRMREYLSTEGIAPSSFTGHNIENYFQEGTDIDSGLTKRVTRAKAQKCSLDASTPSPVLSDSKGLMGSGSRMSSRKNKAKTRSVQKSEGSEDFSVNTPYQNRPPLSLKGRKELTMKTKRVFDCIRRTRIKHGSRKIPSAPHDIRSSGGAEPTDQHSSASIRAKRSGSRIKISTARRSCPAAGQPKAQKPYSHTDSGQLSVSPVVSDVPANANTRALRRGSRKPLIDVKLPKQSSLKAAAEGDVSKSCRALIQEEAAQELSCQLCGMRLNYPAEDHVFLHIHTTYKLSRFSCKICEYQCVSKSALWKHIGEIHEAVPQSEYQEIIVDRTKELGNLYQDMAVGCYPEMFPGNSRKRGKKCQICKKEISEERLDAHVSVHMSSVKLGRFQCLQCKETRHDKDMLYKMCMEKHNSTDAIRDRFDEPDFLKLFSEWHKTCFPTEAVVTKAGLSGTGVNDCHTDTSNRQQAEDVDAAVKDLLKELVEKVGRGEVEDIDPKMEEEMLAHLISEKDLQNWAPDYGNWKMFGDLKGCI